jgi:hypothetical protein
MTGRFIALDSIVLLANDLPIGARLGGRWTMMSSDIKQRSSGVSPATVMGS